MFFSSWTPEKVNQAALDQIEANAGDAGSYVEAEARRRLQAIREPEWGAGYRRNVVASLLMHKVQRTGDEVVITVGVATSEKSRHHGLYIELGSSTAPAQPFLRPAVFENGAKIVGLLTRPRAGNGAQQ